MMLPDLGKDCPVQQSFFLRPSQKEEIDLMSRLKKIEKAHPGIYDFDAFQLLDNYQFWTGLYNNEPIAFFGTATYDSGLSYFGSYFVKKQFRGNGFGLKIWNFVLSRSKGTNLALNGAPAMQKKYEEFGFKTQSNGIIFHLKGTNKKYQSQSLVDCKYVDFNLLNEYDKQNFPGSREKFLEAWIRLPECKAIAFVRNNKIQGYGAIRVTHTGYKLGPLTANNYEVAAQILRGLISQVSQEAQIRFQTAVPHQDVLRLAKQFKMEEQFRNARMFTNGQPQAFKKKTIYSITSPEFG